MTEEPTPPPVGRRSTTVLIVVAAVLAVLLIVAIVLLVVSASPGPAPTPGPTTSASVRPSPTVTPAPATPTSTPTASAATCAVSSLSVSLGQSSGGAGSTDVPLVFRNTGSRPCRLEGVSGGVLVGGGNGTQVGAAAGQDPSVAITVLELAPGDSVAATIRVSNASNYGTCGSQKTDGFRVYPPHSVNSVFVATTQYAPCSDTSVILLKVTPVQQR